jgi:hypothetical protein
MTWTPSPRATWIPNPHAVEDAADVQRWAILAGSFRNDAEEAELRALIRHLEARGHTLSPPCAQRKREAGT